MQLHGSVRRQDCYESRWLEGIRGEPVRPSAPGTVDSDGKLKLFEQQIIDQKPKPGNKVVETLSVRRPTVSDPNTLGPTQQISETTCKGKCVNAAQ